MRIAIAGCGIAGASVACLLQQNGHEVTIFEQADVCRPVGAGIMLQTSGQQVLKRLGLLKELASKSQKLHGMTAKLASGKTLVKIEFGKFDKKIYSLGVHRGRLFELLRNRCKTSGVEIRTGCKVIGFDAKHKTVQLDLSADGNGEPRQHGFDFLVAADGSRSAVRENCLIKTNVKEYDYAALWKTARCAFQPDELYQIVDGTHRLLGMLPIGKGEISFFWGQRKHSWPDVQRSDFDRWKSEVSELCPQAAEIVDGIGSFADLTFGTYRNVSMKRWYQEKVIFIGDAAHAMSPHLGQGVNLALEDAETFANTFRETNDFEAACELYSKLRWRKLRYYQQLTKMLTPFFQSKGSLRGMGRDAVLPILPRLPFVGRRMVKTLSGQQNGWL